MKYGPEIWAAILDHRLPPRGSTGGVLVILGVFFEVALGVLLTSTSERLKQINDLLIAESSQKAAEAAERTAAAELQIDRIRSGIQPRWLVMGDRDGDKNVRGPRRAAIAKYAGTPALIQGGSA